MHFALPGGENKLERGGQNTNVALSLAAARVTSAVGTVFSHRTGFRLGLKPRSRPRVSKHIPWRKNGHPTIFTAGSTLAASSYTTIVYHLHDRPLMNYNSLQKFIVLTSPYDRPSRPPLSLHYSSSAKSQSFKNSSRKTKATPKITGAAFYHT
ncbi:hypothetical protein ACFQ5T_02100 [Levilactobacillus fuyuanensis]|uniref:Carbohydrate kinase PfkB domain-containing protein n=1 Tax=Levilactobacillus fuyuanensis TaxID=2486022 RepID=A0ABW4H1C1_9LACO